MQRYTVVAFIMIFVGVLFMPTNALLAQQPVDSNNATDIKPFNDPIPMSSRSISMGSHTQRFVGQGFDRYQIPTLSQMQDWITNSPYKAVNLYIGGVYSYDNNLTASFIKQLDEQGWVFIPTWVGPQAPCSGYSSKISYNTTNAYNQGVSQANEAIEAVKNLGLTSSDGSGSIIYYDLEGYGYDGTNSNCTKATKAFISGWTAQLHEKGNLAGVYGSSYDSGIKEFFDIDNIPDAIWGAHAYRPFMYRSNASVWNMAGVENTMWSDHQRIRQYAIDHYDTWGKTTLDIDSNVIDGIVATTRQYAVGQGSSRQSAFQRAYNVTQNDSWYKEYFGSGGYGTPTATAEWYNIGGGKRMVIQKYSNDVWFTHDEDSDSPKYTIPVYPLGGHIKEYWLRYKSTLGIPTSNPFKNDANQWQQNFANGYIITGGSVGSASKYSWPSSCSSGKFKLEVRNVLKMSGSKWPPYKGSYSKYLYRNRDLPGGPSLVVCTSMKRNGYALYYEPGSNPAFGSSGKYGIWSDSWVARITGKISGMPSNYWNVKAYCDDGCYIRVNNVRGWKTKVYSSKWRNQGINESRPVGRFGVNNGSEIDIKWFDNQWAAAVMLELDESLKSPAQSDSCLADVIINDDATAVNTLDTTLTLSATNASEVRLATQTELLDVASWQPYTTTIPWQFQPSTETITHTIYAQFRDVDKDLLCDGMIMSDEVVYDTVPPTGTATVEESGSEITTTLKLTAYDTNSQARQETEDNPVQDVLIFETTDTALATTPDEIFWIDWQPYTPEVEVYNAPVYQIWFRDAAGNVSDAVTIDGPVNEGSNTVYLPIVTK